MTRAAPVFRYDERFAPAARAESLIEAVAEPPATRTAIVEDTHGLLAQASPARARAWTFTDRGAARLRAEAEGWLDLYFGRAS